MRRPILSRGALKFIPLALITVLVGISVPSTALAALTPAPTVKVTNVSIYRGATALRDQLQVSVVITAQTTTADWSLRLLSDGNAFTSRSELAAFAHSTKASGSLLAQEAGAAPLVATTPYPASITIYGKNAMTRNLGVRGLWLQLVTNGSIVRSIPLFAYGSADFATTPTPVSWLLPLVEPPHRDLLGNFTDDDLARTLSPEGRLGRILNFRGAGTVTWLVDPELVETAAAMARGYSLVDGTEGAGQQVATAWLKQLRNEAASGNVIALPYGDPDLTTLAHAGLKTEFTRTVAEGLRRLSEALGRPVTEVAAWPSGGYLDKVTQSFIAASDVTKILLSSAAFTSTQTATSSSVGPNVAGKSSLVFDATIANELTDLTPLSANRIAAELTLITAERPAIARAQLLMPTRLWDPNDQAMPTLDSVIPIREVSLAKLTTLAQGAHGALTLAKLSPLKENEVSTLSEIRANLKTFESASGVGNLPLQDETLRSTLLLATSWRGRAFNAYLYASDAKAQSEKIVRRVRVLSGRYTLTTLHQKLPITIANDSTVAAHVTLQLTPTTFRILQPANVQLTLEPKSRTQVMVPIDAITSGDLTLAAAVLTPRGEILGDVTALSVSIRTVPAVANWIVEGAALLLVLAAGAQIFRRVRRRAR